MNVKTGRAVLTTCSWIPLDRRVLRSVRMRITIFFITAIVSTAGFNIFKTPVQSFQEDDSFFGRDIVQSQDGILVTSPSFGKLWRCEQGRNCIVLSEDAPKGVRRIQSVSSKLAEKPGDQHLVCQQVRTKVSVKEDFNGQCLYQPQNQAEQKMNPASDAKNSMNSNNNNNNNNNNNDNNNNNNAFEDEEDPGTEIAFVLDGSGSIEEPDFVQAKTFIIKVMQNVWSTCFDCNFAVVQFGKYIRTELSLMENGDAAKAIRKVNDTKQLGNTTATASAINHVLEEVFVPENGSKIGAKRFIIVVSDGRIYMDPMKLPDVLQKPKMANITRFAIGVGDGILKDATAVKEMKEIASDPDEKHFFEVTNYNALGGILSQIEQGIVGVEGMSQGAGFQLELAEAGFSSHIALDQSLLFGAVGAFDWNGGMIVKNVKSELTAFLNITSNGPNIPKEEHRFSYLGYSVASAQDSNGTLYLSGAPRHKLTGGVFVFSGQNYELQQILLGDQVGSYFGSVLCVLNADKSRLDKTDYLLVGAPHFHRKGEEGKVFVYKLHLGEFQKQDWEWSGVPKYAFARFGSSIANIGDVDGNGYNDVAVGAPLEDGDGETSGSIYIYNGFSDGLQKHHSQRISAAETGMKLRYFGQSVSPMAGPGSKRQEYISVGSEGHVAVFQTLSVIVIEPTIKMDPKMISLGQQSTVILEKGVEIKLDICFPTKRKADGLSFPVQYNIDLDVGQAKERITFSTNKAGQGIYNVTDDDECLSTVSLQYLGCFDCFSPIQIKLKFSLPSSPALGLYVLDEFTPTEIIAEIPFEKECKQETCQADISLSDSRLSKDKVTIGVTQELDITFNLTNTGHGSYKTTLTLVYPNILHFFKISKDLEGSGCKTVTCERNEKVGETFWELTCSLCYPTLRRSSRMVFAISWELEGTKVDEKTAEIRAILTNENKGAMLLDRKNFTFITENALRVGLEGEAEPSSLKNEDESDSKPLEIKFQPYGVNTHNATLNITITIKLETQHTRVDVLPGREFLESTCTFPNDGAIQPQGDYKIQCEQTELKEIVLKMTVHISKTQEQDEKIVVTGELDFDQNTYITLDSSRLKKEVSVTIRKLAVIKSMPAIVGGSIGGFVLLAIIVIILFKCGFFKRRHQVDKRQNY